MHVWTDGEEAVVAADEQDARVVMQELGGSDVWRQDEVDVEMVPDDRVIRIVDEDESGSQAKTAAEWAVSNGRGYLYGPT